MEHLWLHVLEHIVTQLGKNKFLLFMQQITNPVMSRNVHLTFRLNIDNTDTFPQSEAISLSHLNCILIIFAPRHTTASMYIHISTSGFYQEPPREISYHWITV